MPIALIGAVAGVAGAVISAGATDHAANVSANAAAQNNALQSQIYGVNSANVAPYIAAGDKADTALQGFLGIGGDPAATQKAFDNYLGSTGYKFTRQQGLDAVTQSKAASGMLGSGATQKALDSYGTGLAQQFGQQYVGDLQGVAGTGQAAASGLAGTGQAYANAAGANTTNAANAAANAGLANAKTVNGLIGNALTAWGSARGQSSFGGSGGSSGNSGFLNAFNIGGG
jgi:hypothetical protein